MELDEQSVRGLSPDELTRRLAQLGERIGPITPTTRSLYEKRLLRRMRLDTAAACTLTYDLPPIPSSSTPSQEAPSPSPRAGGDTASPSSRNHSSTPRRSASPNEATIASNCAAADDNGVSSGIATGQFPFASDGFKRDNCSASDAAPAAEEAGPFYGVRPPPSSLSEGRVFTCRAEALKYAKDNPNSRFNRFSRRSEAEEFCAPCNDVVEPQSSAAAAPTGEGSAFRGPKTQELVALRKLIESGDAVAVKQLVWSNPRYLIGSGDTPTVLHEGSRYNALHVCAQRNQADICRLLLDTVEDPAFVHLMYPDVDDAAIRERIRFLSDLYLNTPDKAGGEAPLHFACKFGQAEVAAVLASHPRVDRKMKNKYGEMPADVICARVQRPGATAAKERIKHILEDRYYVRLLRSDDRGARVARPWCPGVDEEEGGPPGDERVGGGGCASPKEAPMAVRAYAGPMSPYDAERFHKLWTASPRVGAGEEARRRALLRRGDADKGLERVGRELSAELAVPWSEYWAFLDDYVDLRSESGLSRLERHLERWKREAEEHAEQERAEREQADARLRGVSDVCDLFGKLKLVDRSFEERSTPAGGWKSGRNVFAWHDSPPPMEGERRVLNESGGGGKEASSGGDNEPDADSEDSDCESFTTALDDLTFDVGDDADVEFCDTTDILDTSWSQLVSAGVHYIKGEQPSRVDVHVLRALDGLDVDINRFPLVTFWRNRVESHSEEERRRWPGGRGGGGGAEGMGGCTPRTPLFLVEGGLRGAGGGDGSGGRGSSGSSGSSQGDASLSSLSDSDSTPVRQNLFGRHVFGD